MASEHDADGRLFGLSAGLAVPAARQAIDRTLGRIREILHSKGRLSSRHEALEEVSKLVFAHVIEEKHGGTGISEQALAPFGDNKAQALRGFVAHAYATHLPRSLAHQFDVSDFALRIRDTEVALAGEVVAAFEQLHAAESVRGMAGTSGFDALNDVFGKFLADSFADEKELGQYLTPPEVVQFMVRLAIGSMTPSERRSLGNPDLLAEFGLIVDPSCGVGSFLTEFLRSAQLVLEPGRDPLEWLSVMTNDRLVGIDKSDRMIKLALTNMAMFGFPAARLHLANALGRGGDSTSVTQSIEGQAGLILTNPPFGATFRSDEATGYRIANEWATRPPATIDSELLFVERYLDWLRPGGQLLAIVPDSILTNKGIFEELRNGIGPMVDLLTVVSLPPVTFAAAGTTTKTSVLHLRRRISPSKQSGPARFAICDDVGFGVTTKDSQRVKVSTNSNDLEPILKALVGGEREAARLATVTDATTSHRWDATFHGLMDDATAALMNQADDRTTRLTDIAHISSERVDPRRSGKETFPYIEISDVDGSTLSVTAKHVATAEAPSRARKLVRAGDILVSTVRPERRTIGVVPADLDEAVCSTGFAVIRCTRAHPLIVAHLLRSDFATTQLMRNNVGIAYPAIDESCLADVVLPMAMQSMNDLSEDANQLIAFESAVSALRSNFAGVIAALTVH